ncbi:major facilitator superfamily-domain-containing protein [Amylocarpus encephaloides]|uniref:Major facilitator superfamily-domain-containing protein n=1 Tax=Amylocarpus encephaloides TaxID=45428 RepID=A0A9P8C6H4_9HELO|nr:major facilitator superfamily-domain-containing protein [Amylocarpus encephaloides]
MGEIKTIRNGGIEELRTEPVGTGVPDKAMFEELAPVTIVKSTAGSEPNDVTVRQVAPLVLVLTGATFLNTLSVQSVVILLPQISSDLDIPSTRQEWVVSAFALTSGSFLLLFGKLADVYGKKLLFVLGCFWVTATGLGSAFSPVEVCIYIMRALQGLGSALSIPTAYGIIGYTIPPGRIKNYAFAFCSGGAPTGQIIGNLLGGIVSQCTSWKVVFFIIAGMSFLVGVTAILVIPKEPSRKVSTDNQTRASGVDWVGAFLFTAGTLLLLTGLSEGVSQGWKTPYVIAILILSVLFLVSFVYWQHYLEARKITEPLVRVSTFKNAKFAFSMVIVCLFSAGFTNFLVYSTYFYQNYQILSPIQTTLRFLPLGIVGIIATFGSGYLLSRLRGDFILIFGLASAAIANLLFAAPIPPSTSYFAYGFPAMALAAFGADTIYPCLGLFTTQALPRKDQSLAGAMFQTVASIGRAMFLPVAAAIQYSVQDRKVEQGGDDKAAYLAGLRSAEWLCFGLMMVSLAITFVGLRNMGKIGLLKKLGNVQSSGKEKDPEKATS